MHEAAHRDAWIPSRLAAHAQELGPQPALTFLGSGQDPARTLSFADLHEQALAVAEGLRAAGLAGERVLLLYPAGLDYVVRLLGCLYAGATAVPAYPPGGSGVRLTRAAARVSRIVADARVVAACAPRALVESLRGLSDAVGSELSSLKFLEFQTVGRTTAPATPSATTPALLQYTSGSTSAPKGVVLSQAALVANLEAIHTRSELDRTDTVISWLPPYHDMGLVGGIIEPLYVGAHAILMAPEAFVRRPVDWLRAITRQRATTAIAPNFAFDLCVRRVRPRDRDELDLSSLRIVLNGAEPIDPDTIERFSEAFGPHGFRREALYPCYGMAEATVMISGGTPGRGPVVRWFDIAGLERGIATPGADGTTARRCVGVGRALPNEEIRIVDARRAVELPPRRVGEIWVRSRSAAEGYWQRPDESAQTFGAHLSDGAGPFLRTGDLGFLDDDGELFVTGRLKDLIIIRGRNHYPQDIERTVQAVHPALLRDAGVALARRHEGSEELVIVQEVHRSQVQDLAGLFARIAQAIRDEHDLAPASIVLIKKGTLLKTSSGKVRRSATGAALAAGELSVAARWDARRPHGPAPHPTPRAGAASRSEPAPLRSYTRELLHTREQEIVDWLSLRLSEKLATAATELDPHAPLAQLGVDSLMAAELTEELEQWLGTSLPATISYDNPTLAALARALAAPAPVQDSARTRTPTPTHGVREPEEPVAIVGMACRFPGADELSSYWKLLRMGIDAITEVPAERWDTQALYDPEPGKPGKLCSRFGGFVSDIDRFDARFFGISPHEARSMDPQQRLFLEVAWEALEDAALPPDRLAGSDTGVFAAACSNDYSLLYAGTLALVGVDYGTGSATSLVANRLSYTLDLRGPSKTIDAACASSLCAIDDACKSLRNLECEVAIVGGVNAVLSPEASIYFSQARMLARDGRCKSFDARADGFVRSEGCGVVVLKRLSRAERDGDRIYALIAGSAVSHAGRSSGLTAPNGPAQQAVVRKALAAAHVDPGELGYIEAHGVGSAIADAVELRALGAVLKGRSQDDPVRLGSAKANIGHLEAAAGMAGLIKTALALAHEEIPPQPHFRDPNPDAGLDQLPIEIASVATLWPRGGSSRCAGVSAFGFGGMHAHVVLREAPLRARRTTVPRSHHLLTLSARSPSALRTQAVRWTRRLFDQPLADLCYGANAGRARFEHRLALRVTSVEEAHAALVAFARGSSTPEATSARVRPGTRAVVGLVFEEHALAPGSAVVLHAEHEVVRRVLNACQAAVEPHLPEGLYPLLAAPDDPLARQLLSRPAHAHTALVSLQLALVELWRSFGVAPALVYGRGAGEYSAAVAAGVLSVGDALELVVRRGLVLEGLVPGAARSATPHQFKQALARAARHAARLPLVSMSFGRVFAFGQTPDTHHFNELLYYDSAAQRDQGEVSTPDCDVRLEIALSPVDALQPWDTLTRAMQRLYLAGAELDFEAIDRPYAEARLALPSYPFERERHWLPFPERGTETEQAATTRRPFSHPLITRRRILTGDADG